MTVSVPFLLSSATLFVSLLMLFLVMRSWGQARMKHFALYAALIAFCSIAWYLQCSATNLEGAFMGLRLRFLPGPFLPLVALLCGLDYGDRIPRYRSAWGFLLIIPFFCALAVLFCDLDSGFFVTRAVMAYTKQGLVFNFRPGLIYTIFFVFSTCMDGLLLLHIARYIVAKRRGIPHIIIFAIVFMLPPAAGLIFFLGIFPGYDFSMVTRVLALVLIYGYIRRYRGLEWRRLDWNAVAGDLSDAVIVLNSQRKIVKVNPAFISCFPSFSWRKNETTLEEFVEFLRERRLESWPESLLEDLVAGREFQADRVDPAESGGLYRGELTIGPARQSFTLAFRIIRREEGTRPRSGESPMLGQVIILNDVSSYRGMIEEISALKIRAEEASRAKGKFLAVMSHELRTPLNAIIGFAEILLYKMMPSASAIVSMSAQGGPTMYGDPTAAAAFNTLQTTRKNLTQIRDAGRALLSIINNILDISKIEDGNLEPLNVPYRTSGFLTGMLRQSVPGINGKPVEFHLAIDPELPEELLGDEIRLSQIVGNLLSNAVQFTERGTVSLRVRWEREGNDTAFLVFEVSDTGPGIRSEFIPELFTRRSRLNSATGGSRSGSGLGLVISRNLAELMGGTVTVKSVFGQGSVFTAVVRQQIASKNPIGRETADLLTHLRYDEEDAAGTETVRMDGRVLIVDDMATNIDVARALLSSCGIESDSASSGEEAIALLRDGDTIYDIVFMDHLMPGMDGFEAARKIRALGGVYARSVPIIILTALTPDDETASPSGGDINGFLYKPIESAKLRQILTTWMPRGYTPAAAGASVDGTASWKLFSLPGVDVLQGITAAGGDTGAYLRVLDLFRSDAAERLSPLDAALRAGDLLRYARLLRPLKSALKAIGAEAAAASAARLEEAAKAGDQTKLDSGGGFIRGMEALALAIDQVLENRANTGTEPAK